MMFFSQETQVLMYNFCKTYLLAETRNELYQVINNFFFIPFVNFDQAPLKNFQEGVNFFETTVSLGTKKNSKTYFV